MQQSMSAYQQAQLVNQQQQQQQQQQYQQSQPQQQQPQSSGILGGRVAPMDQGRSMPTQTTLNFGNNAATSMPMAQSTSHSEPGPQNSGAMNGILGVPMSSSGRPGMVNLAMAGNGASNQQQSNGNDARYSHYAGQIPARNMGNQQQPFNIVQSPQTHMSLPQNQQQQQQQQIAAAAAAAQQRQIQAQFHQRIPPQNAAHSQSPHLGGQAPGQNDPSVGASIATPRAPHESQSPYSTSLAQAQYLALQNQMSTNRFASNPYGQPNSGIVGSSHMAARGKPIVGTAVLRLLQYGEYLGNGGRQHGDVTFWKNFVSDFFIEGGQLRTTLWNSNDKDSKQFGVPYPILARYYYTMFSSRIKQIQLVLENPREFLTSQGGHFVDCSKASYVYWFDNGSHVISRGSLRVVFDHGLKIECFDFRTAEHCEFLSRHMMEIGYTKAGPRSLQSSRSNDLNDQKNRGGSENDKRQSPQNSTSNGDTPNNPGRQSQKPSLPESLINCYGVPDPVMRCLEIAETISHMNDLILLSTSTNTGGPLRALQQFATALQNRELVQAQRQQQLQAQMHQTSNMTMQGRNDMKDTNGIEAEALTRQLSSNNNNRKINSNNGVLPNGNNLMTRISSSDINGDRVSSSSVNMSGAQSMNNTSLASRKRRASYTLKKEQEEGNGIKSPRTAKTPASRKNTDT